MKTLHRVIALLTMCSTSALTRWRGPDSDHPERGDVPGWVMITMMSALLVAALLAIAIPALTGMFESAMQKIG